MRWIRTRQRHSGVRSDGRIEVFATRSETSVIEQGSESAGSSVFGASWMTIYMEWVRWGVFGEGPKVLAGFGRSR